MPTMIETTIDTYLSAIQDAAERAGVFGSIERGAEMLRCAAPAAGAEAWYRVRREGDDAGAAGAGSTGTSSSGASPGTGSPKPGARWWVELVTPDRWLSESVEADLMHHGDPIEELVEEELVELGAPAGRPQVQHFRSDDLLYTFRSPLAGDPPSVDETMRLLLAYEAAFRELGDIEADEEE